VEVTRVVSYTAAFAVSLAFWVLVLLAVMAVTA
jgi:hypothetical protein